MAAMRQLLLMVAVVLTRGVVAIDTIDTKLSDPFDNQNLRVPLAFVAQPNEARCRPTRCLAFMHHKEVTTSPTTDCTTTTTESDTETTTTVTETTTETFTTVADPWRDGTDFILPDDEPNTETTESRAGPISLRVNSLDVAREDDGKDSSTIPSTSTTPTSILTTGNMDSLTRVHQVDGSASVHEAHTQEISRLTKLGSQFLKLAAQQATSLSAEDRKHLNDDSLLKATRSALRYAKALTPKVGDHASARALTASRTLRGSHPKPRPVCTITSGYWSQECEGEFIPRPSKPHRPDVSDKKRPKLGTSIMPVQELEPTRGPLKPAHPQREEHVTKMSDPNHYRDECAERLDCIFAELECFLDFLASLARKVRGKRAFLPSEQKEKKEVEATLTQLAKLQSIVKNQTLAHRVVSTGGEEMEHFLAQKLADVEEMVADPGFLDNQLEISGVEQPLVLQMQTIIDKLEPFNY